MSSSWKLYLFLSLFFILVQGIFSMLEMACVSFNKIRLQYYVSLKKRRALWLYHLLQRPALLFGVTLIGVNSCLQLGSECSRRFYEGLGLSPDLAPISQILLVLIFAEFAPMLAGRQYAEHVVMAGIPFLYGVSIILRPVIWFFDILCQAINYLTGSKAKEGVYLTREELQHLFESREEAAPATQEMSTIAGNIFALKNKKALDAMIALNQVHMVPSFFTVGEMRLLLRSKYVPYVPIYQRTPQNIVGVVYPRDLLRISEEKLVKDYARPAWFIAEESSIFQILKQFRKNNQNMAIVLNEIGLAVGILTLDEILDEIFGRQDQWEPFEDSVIKKSRVMIDLSLPSTTLIADFNRKYAVHLEAQGGIETIGELMEKQLGHEPALAESVRIDQLEFTIEEAPLIGPKIIAIRSTV
jgi:CBS domain containing-hemolysin-like protein